MYILYSHLGLMGFAVVAKEVKNGQKISKKSSHIKNANRKKQQTNQYGGQYNEFHEPIHQRIETQIQQVKSFLTPSQNGDGTIPGYV